MNENFTLHNRTERSKRLILLLALLSLAAGLASLPGVTGVRAEESGTIPPPALAVTGVIPQQGLDSSPTELYVTGRGFVSGAAVSLRLGAEERTLVPTFVAGDFLRGQAPAGLAAGVYDIVVRLPDGRKSILAHVYTSMSTAAGDLSGYSHELWSVPGAFRVSRENQLRLVVHRIGGRTPLADVPVRFYLGDPTTGGALLGTGAVPVLAPGGVGSTSGVLWHPTLAGEFTLYAQIDSENLFSDTVRANNTVSRTITVLPATIDLTPPVVERFVIDENAADTTVRPVKLSLEAGDPAPGSGVRRFFVREYFFSQSAARWIPVQESGWQELVTPVRADFGWTLLPMPGVRVLLAWVADNAGNISLPVETFINYISMPDQLAQNQVRLYRYWLQPGDRLEAAVVPADGDPDLYVWAPLGVTPRRWVSNQSGATVEALALTAPVVGVYQLEVYAFAATAHTLTVALAPAPGLGGAGVGSLPRNNYERQEPLVTLELNPGNEQSVPGAPAAATQWRYLPLVHQQ